jgi:hypothetical protein
MTSAASFGRWVPSRRGSLPRPGRGGAYPGGSGREPGRRSPSALPTPRGHRGLSSALRDPHDSRFEDQSPPEHPARPAGRGRNRPLRARRVGVRACLSARGRGLGDPAHSEPRCANQRAEAAARCSLRQTLLVFLGRRGSLCQPAENPLVTRNRLTCVRTQNDHFARTYEYSTTCQWAI